MNSHFFTVAEASANFNIHFALPWAIIQKIFLPMDYLAFIIFFYISKLWNNLHND